MGSMEDYVKEKAGGIVDSDISWVLANVAGIVGKLVGPLETLAGQVRLFISMLVDYQAGRYSKAPVWTVCVVAFTLLYILMPFDLVPDFIPFAGLADDALVVAAALSMVGEDLKAYEAWQGKEGGTIHRADGGGG